jgi:aspartate-semialdehyde dehydrogenase
MSSKFRVGIIGATGTVGQRFIQMLERHPQFGVTPEAGSGSPEGNSYTKACIWTIVNAELLAAKGHFE